MGERPRYREARDTLARDLLETSRQTTHGTEKRPLTPEEAQRRAAEVMRRVDQKESERGK